MHTTYGKPTSPTRTSPSLQPRRGSLTSPAEAVSKRREHGTAFKPAPTPVLEHRRRRFTSPPHPRHTPVNAKHEADHDAARPRTKPTRLLSAGPRIRAPPIRGDTESPDTLSGPGVMDAREAHRAVRTIPASDARRQPVTRRAVAQYRPPEEQQRPADTSSSDHQQRNFASKSRQQRSPPHPAEYRPPCRAQQRPPPRSRSTSDSNIGPLSSQAGPMPKQSISKKYRPTHPGAAQPHVPRAAARISQQYPAPFAAAGSRLNSGVRRTTAHTSGRARRRRPAEHPGALREK